MLRKTFVAFAAALVVVASLAPPASARNTRVTVRGNAISAAGLYYVASQCHNPRIRPSVSPNEHPVKDGGALGSHAMGWQFSQAGNEVGALAPVGRPSRLSVLRAKIKSANGAGLTGHVVAHFDPTNRGFQSGYWVGRQAFTLEFGGWVTVNAATTDLQWVFYDASGAPVAGTEQTGSVAEMGRAYGNGSGAFVGYMMGCNGWRFWTDALTVGNSANTRTYDFEGARSRAHIEYSTDGRKVRNGNLRVKYGKKLWVLGHSHGRRNGNVDFYTAPGTLYAKKHGRSKFRKVATKDFHRSHYAAFLVAPKRRTTYQFRTGGSDYYDASRSEKMVVSVVPGVSAKVLDKTLRRGQRVVLRGQLRPGNRGTKVALQRKAGGRWVTMSQARTGRRGVFVVRAVARTTGTLTVRAKVSPGKGNLGTTTRSIRVEVKRRVPPPPAPTDANQGSTQDDVVYVPPPAPGPAPAPPHSRALPGRTSAGAAAAGSWSVPGSAIPLSLVPRAEG